MLAASASISREAIMADDVMTAPDAGPASSVTTHGETAPPAEPVATEEHPEARPESVVSAPIEQAPAEHPPALPVEEHPAPAEVAALGVAEALASPPEAVQDGETAPPEELAPAEEAAAEPEAPPPAPEPSEGPEAPQKHWYVVKVTSGREDTIKESIERRVKKEGLEEYFGQIVIPVEKYTEVKTNAKTGKRITRTKERKLYPGYLMVEVSYNDRILYLFRETSGVGDFVGTTPGNLEKPPTPMSAKEVARMLGPQGGQGGEAAPVVAPPPKGLDVGERVRVVDGTFNGMEGTVKQILEAQAKLQVELTIFGRPVAVELEYYQVEQA